MTVLSSHVHSDAARLVHFVWDGFEAFNPTLVQLYNWNKTTEKGGSGSAYSAVRPRDPSAQVFSD